MPKSLLRFQKLVPISLFAVVLSLLMSAQADAQVLWYNGDNNGVNSEIGVDSSAAGGESGIVYDDFTVTDSEGWDVTGALGNFIFKDATTGAFESGVTLTGVNWAIYSTVSSGSTGTPVASGSGTADVSTSLNANNHTIFNISVTGLNVDLGAGTYWLALQPVTSDAELGYLLTTSGTNAVGTPAGNDSNAYATNTYGANVESTTSINPNLTAFSLGVTGSVVPEPSTWALALGSVGLLLCLRTRFKRQ